MAAADFISTDDRGCFGLWAIYICAVHRECADCDFFL